MGAYGGYTAPPRERHASGLSSLRIIEQEKPELGFIDASAENVRRACSLAGWVPGQWPEPGMAWDLPDQSKR